EAYYRQALEMRQKLYPPQRYPQGHPELGTCLNNLGNLLEAQGEYARAEPYLRQALAMDQKLYPPERYPQGHPDLAGTLNNLGLLLDAQGEYARAEPYYRQALAMYQALRERLTQTTAQALNYLARIPATRDAFLSVSRHQPPHPSVYDLLWQGKGALTR